MQEFEVTELLGRARLGDKSAIGQLLAGHRDRLRRMIEIRLSDRLARRIDPSDVVQETLMIASKKLSDFLSDEQLPFYAWLRQIAWSQLMRLGRHHVEVAKRSVNREQSLGISEKSAIQLAEQLAASQDGPLTRVLRNEMRIRVRSALRRLADNDREILILRHLEQLSFAETAAVLQISEMAAKQRHVRALRRIRQLLDDETSRA
jgi:RNA polymerase sigma-70 factor (ECF subfamily)